MYLPSRLAISSLRSPSPLLAFSSRRVARLYSTAPMAGGDNVPIGGRAKTKKVQDGGLREVKILMLHGYTQSGPLFRSKTRALEKMLAKALAPSRLTPVLIYPTAPNPLSAADIPGYTPPSDPTDAALDPDAWAWFRKDEATATYRLLPTGMAALAAVIRTQAGGRVHGVLGFSQGGFMAGALAAALEPGRTPPAPDAEEWADDLRAANGGHALGFAVVYSGFFAPQEALGWLYGGGGVRTPTLHFIGSLDTVVDEGRSRGLVERCVGPVVVVHPGGHYVPVSKEWVAPLVGFVREYAGREEEEVVGAGLGEGEEKVVERM